MDKDTVDLHLDKQRAHAQLTSQDYDQMKDTGCPVCKAQAQENQRDG